MESIHPILLQQAFTIKAPPLQEFVLEFGRLVKNGELSMVCYGSPRAGKTTARRFLQSGLDKVKQAIVLSAFIELDPGRTDNKNRLWRDLLRGTDRALSMAPSNPYDALFNKICVDADRYDVNRVLIILDEAQNLSLEKLGGLKKLVDELIEHGLSPFVLLMAQPQILARPKRLQFFQYQDLVDRFFTRMHRFRGVLPGEIAGVLKFYDETQWPSESGISFTAGFVPQLWATGWRMEQQAPLFQSVIADLSRRLSLPNNEIGMKYLVTSVRILLNYLSDGSSEPRDIKELILKSVKDSGLVQASEMVGDSVAAALMSTGRPKGGNRLDA